LSNISSIYKNYFHCHKNTQRLTLLLILSIYSLC